MIYKIKWIMRKISYSLILLLFFLQTSAQLKWENIDSLYQPLSSSVHIYFTKESIDTGAFRAFYIIADLKDKMLDFTADTTYKRRLTPSQFFKKDNQPLVVVNCTFFSFETNKNLNVVIKDQKIVSYNIHSISGRGKDTFTYRHTVGSAIGISRKRKVDIAWLFTDSLHKYPYANQSYRNAVKDSFSIFPFEYIKGMKYLTFRDEIAARGPKTTPMFHKWKMQTAVGGGPVLLQYGKIEITNNEELKFIGKAINDKHPRTAMGYTKEGKLIILVIQGRSESGGGESLPQEEQILKDLGCWEALNLDGGGSSCMLINGKETIKPSDKEGERPVPAVFIIKQK